MNNSPWISVKERLPEQKRQHISDILIRSETRIAPWNSECQFPTWATHWMPIPELPKPDPFTEWWKVYGISCASVPVLVAKDAWNAALKHAKEAA